MNSFMGARSSKLPAIPRTAANYVPFFTRDSDIVRPSQTWVFLDEDERSIDDGFFVTDPTAHVWFSFPAISAHRHNFSYNLAFADNHCETWRHMDPRTFAVHAAETEASGNHDLDRLANAATVSR
jgi:prepilin-type processing-associated H-X9-DG protein